MAITFAYTQATNIVVVTEGTSGTPATFADFVTQDRAGTLTLLDAGVIDADPDTFSLTTQPRPCEKGVIALTIATSADRVGATIDIVGKDYDSDAVQELAIDISGANTTPVTTIIKFNTVDASGITVDGMTNDDTVTITQGQWGVIWDYGNGQYQVDANLDIGNGSTSTYFTTILERVTSVNVEVNITASATLCLGVKNADYGVRGTTWHFKRVDTNITPTHAGTFLGYGSIISYENAAGYQDSGSVWDFQGANSEVYDSTFHNWSYLQISSGASDIDWRRSYSTESGNRGVKCWGATITDIVIIDPKTYGFELQNSNTLIRPTLVGTPTEVVNFLPGPGEHQYITDQKTDIDWTDGDWNPWEADAYEQYTCNIHVVDQDGTAIQSVVVDCEDQAASAVWTAGTVTTDASGDITEQNIVYITYTKSNGNVGSTTNSPHKFTISKAGYETLILDAVTVDGAINWHLELQASKQPPGTETIF